MRTLLTAIAVLLPAVALAHGDAAWIQHDPRYTMQHSPTTHCCDPSHCRAVGPDFAQRVAGGWRAPTGEVAEDDGPGLYLSVDHQFWACGSDRFTWCLFVPPSGA
jgi:hypothetical protein